MATIISYIDKVVEELKQNFVILQIYKDDVKQYLNPEQTSPDTINHMLSIICKDANDQENMFKMYINEILDIEHPEKDELCQCIFTEMEVYQKLIKAIESYEIGQIDFKEIKPLIQTWVQIRYTSKIDNEDISKNNNKPRVTPGETKTPNEIVDKKPKNGSQNQEEPMKSLNNSKQMQYLMDNGDRNKSKEVLKAQDKIDNSKADSEISKDYLLANDFAAEDDNNQVSIHNSFQIKENHISYTKANPDIVNNEKILETNMFSNGQKKDNIDTSKVLGNQDYYQNEEGDGEREREREGEGGDVKGKLIQEKQRLALQIKEKNIKIDTNAKSNQNLKDIELSKFIKTPANLTKDLISIQESIFKPKMPSKEIKNEKFPDELINLQIREKLEKEIQELRRENEYQRSEIANLKTKVNDYSVLNESLKKYKAELTYCKYENEQLHQENQDLKNQIVVLNQKNLQKDIHVIPNNQDAIIQGDKDQIIVGSNQKILDKQAYYNLMSPNNEKKSFIIGLNSAPESAKKSANPRENRMKDNLTENKEKVDLSISSVTLDDKSLYNLKKKFKGMLVAPDDIMLTDMKKSIIANGSEKMLNSFKLSCLTNKSLIFDNDIMQIGVTTMLIEDQITRRNHLKISLYYGSNIKNDPNAFLKAIILPDPSFLAITRPEKVECNISNQTQFKQQIILNFLKFPFKCLQTQCKISGLNINLDQKIDFSLYLPTTINKFMNFKPIEMFSFKAKWKDSNYTILKTSEMRLNTGIIQTASDFNKYFPNLFKLMPKDEYALIIGKEYTKFGGYFELDIPGIYYLIKIIVLPNQYVVFQLSCLSKYVEIGAFILQTLAFLFEI